MEILQDSTELELDNDAQERCKGRFPFRVFSCAGGKFLRIFFKEPIRFHAKKPRRKNTRNGKRPLDKENVFQ